MAFASQSYASIALLTTRGCIASAALSNNLQLL